MDSSMRYWAPNSVEPNLMPLLAVRLNSRQQMTPQLHRQLMLEKLAALFKKEGEKEAARALEMSSEQMPELLSIRQQEPVNNWPMALLSSDLMSAQMRKINWSQETIGTRVPQKEIASALSDQSLSGLLEML